MIWDDLKFDYTRMLLKTLSPSETRLMNDLQGNVNELLDYSLNWINDNYSILSDFESKDDWDSFFQESEFRLLIFQLLDKLNYDVLVNFKSFYNAGAILAYNHLDKQVLFRESDEKSFGILEDYVKSVLDSIGGEFIYGIKEVIGDAVDEGDGFDKLGGDLLSLPFTPIDNVFSVNVRCLFTAKTEYARAINTGLLQAYSNYGVDSFDWVCSGLSNVCNKCLEIEKGGPYSLKELMVIGMPHPNCACSVKGRLHLNHSLKSNPVIVDLTP